jgi:hypothetical protein
MSSENPLVKCEEVSKVLDMIWDDWLVKMDMDGLGKRVMIERHIVAASDCSAVRWDHRFTKFVLRRTTFV